MNNKAEEYSKRRKTPPMTQAQIKAVVEPQLSGDYQLGVQIHKAVLQRLKEYKLYGTDVGAETFHIKIEEIRKEYLQSHAPYKNRFDAYIHEGILDEVIGKK